VATLDKDSFDQFVKVSPATREIIQKTSDQRYQSLYDLIEENNHVDPSLA